MRYPDYTPKFEPLDNFKAIVVYLTWVNRLRHERRAVRCKNT
jgi:hypothetical protein